MEHKGISLGRDYGKRSVNTMVEEILIILIKLI